MSGTTVSSAESWQHASRAGGTGGAARNYDGANRSQRLGKASRQHGGKRQKIDNHCKYDFSKMISKKMSDISEVFMQLQIWTREPANAPHRQAAATLEALAYISPSKSYIHLGNKPSSTAVVTVCTKDRGKI